MIESLRQVYVGKLLVEADDVAPYLTDWRKLWTGSAIAVALPTSTAEVATLVRWCAENDVSVVPQGGNTGLSGGSVPQAGGCNLVISLTRMARVRELDAVNNTLTVDAGCRLTAVQDAATEAGRLFPLSLAAEGSCTIGGNLASNAGGTAVLRYGNARELCLGLEVVTAKGGVWDGLKGLRKDNTGYDLRDLYIGSEGTLGIITGAVLKMFPQPSSRVVAFCGVESIEASMELLGLMSARHTSSLTAFELVSREALELVVKHAESLRDPMGEAHPWYVLVEFTSFESEEICREMLEVSLADAFEQGVVQDAVVADSLSQSKALWSLRESISESQSAEGFAIKHDVSVPITDIADFVGKAIQAVAQSFPDARPIVFGHLGDGSLHFNYSPPVGKDDGAFRSSQTEMNAIVHDLVVRHRGSISAEHGLGVLRRDEIDAIRSNTERDLMRSIKLALDPRGIMNPGKLLPL